MLTETNKEHIEFNNENNENTALNEPASIVNETNNLDNNIIIEQLDNKNKEDVIVDTVSETTAATNDDIIIEEEDESDNDDLTSKDPAFLIVDGIMFLNFANENDLNEYTAKDEKLRKKNENDKKQKAIRNKRTSTASINKSTTSITSKQTSTTVRKKSQTTSSTINSRPDSAFVSDELDDYLNSRKSKNKFKSTTNDLDSSFNSSTTSIKKPIKTIIKRKTNDHIKYNDDSSEYTTFNDYLETSSLDQSSNYSFNKQRKTPGKSLNLIKSTKSKNKRPEMIVINETKLDLKETTEFDNAYYKCLSIVKKAYDNNLEKSKNKFKPVILNDNLCRIALTTLDSNSQFNLNLNSNLKNNLILPKHDLIKKTIDKKQINTNDLDITNLSNNLENRDQKDNNLFKLDPTEDKLNNKEIKQEPINESIEKSSTIQKRKIKNDYKEEDIDITRIISKHSKRDIRLPVRYHESSILVGSQWILPDFDEHKNRVVNTSGNGKKSRKSNINKLIDNSLINNEIIDSKIDNINNNLDNNLDDNSTSQSPILISPIKNDQLNTEDLMTEDEDVTITQPPSTLNNTPLNDKKIISKLNKQELEKERKIVILREMYRQLFYANKPQRKDYFASRSTKPRVNKSEVLQEGIETIKAMQTQKKCLNHTNNLLITWNNKLKLCLNSLEQLKNSGVIDPKELESNEKILNSYRINITNKINKELLTVKQLDETINLFDINQKSITSTQSNSTDQINNNLNSILNPSSSSSSSFKQSHPHQNQQSTTFNCQSNIAFLDNTNGVSRVFNLKPKKTVTTTTPSTKQVNVLNLKPNDNSRIINNNKSKSKTYIISNNQMNNRFVNGNNVNRISSGINRVQLHNQQNLNRNLISFNNFQPPTSNSFLTLKITGNGLQKTTIPVPSSTTSTTATNPIMNNISTINPTPQNPIRNYAKILPKFSNNQPTLTNNMIKVSSPQVSYIPTTNLQFIPKTHNLVISPHINNISSTITTAFQTNSTNNQHNNFQKPTTTNIIVNSKSDLNKGNKDKNCIIIKNQINLPKNDVNNVQKKEIT